MPTIREIAEQCGVSKSTAVRAANRLGIKGQRTDGGRKAAVFNEAETSAIAHEIQKSRPYRTSKVSERTESTPSEPNRTESDRAKRSTSDDIYIERLEQAYRDRISDLKAQIELLTTQLESREEKIASLETQLEMQAKQTADGREEAAELRATVDRMRHASLTERLFGFKRLLPPPGQSTD